MKEGPPTPVVKSKPSPKPVTKPVAKAVEGPEKSSVKPSQAAETTPAGTSVAKNRTSHDGLYGFDLVYTVLLTLIAVVTLFYPAEQGYSIFVKSLPFNSTVQMVEEDFKKFGAIKPGGIQVRNNKVSSRLVAVCFVSSYAACLTFLLYCCRLISTALALLNLNPSNPC